MEDDDDFGDLYTDVLRQVPSSTQQEPSCRHGDVSTFLQSAQLSSSYSFGFGGRGDTEKNILKDSSCGSSSQLQKNDLKEQNHVSNQLWMEDKKQDDYASTQELDLKEDVALPVPDSELEQELGEIEAARVSDERTDVSQPRSGKEADAVLEKCSAADADRENDSTLNLQSDGAVADVDAEPVIPGLSTAVSSSGAEEVVISNKGTENSAAGGDDWDSDSEDDLQIVLNDSAGLLGADGIEGVASPDEDEEDGEDLVIVAGDGVHHSQPMEEQEWGDESAPPAPDAERKDGTEVSKISGRMGGVAAARIGYSGQGYHHHHSQFKYVRPGASALPGGIAVSGSSASQVRSFINSGSAAGRGRGEWRPVGIKSASTAQKGFAPGYGLPIWANNASMRNFGGGLEFTLPSHKTVFDVDIDCFEEKPWKYPGADASDYFNFGLDEDHWKYYCKKLAQLRLEASMQSKIRVYESGRSEQEYDPDLPPELAAAAGLHDGTAESPNLGKSEGQSNHMGQGRFVATRIRSQLPTGRAIQVEGGCGERLPSIDTRPPRNRDCDAIIEIVLQDSANVDSVTPNGASEPLQLDAHVPVISNEVEKADIHFSSIATCDGECSPHHSSKLQNQAQPVEDFSQSQGKMQSRGTAHGKCLTSEDKPNDVNLGDDTLLSKPNDQKEKLSDDSDGKQMEISLPDTLQLVGGFDIEPEDGISDDQPTLAVNAEIGGKGVSNSWALNGTMEGSNLNHAARKQKLSSRIEAAARQIDNGDNLRLSEGSSGKVRSVSSREHHKRRDGVEIGPDGRSRRLAEVRRAHDEEINHRRDGHGSYVRSDVDGCQIITRIRGDHSHSYQQREMDVSSGHYAHAKVEVFDRHKGRDISAGAGQRRDEHNRRRLKDNESSKRQDRVDEIGTRHKSKSRENEKSEKDDLSRKRIDEGDWRSWHEKETGSGKQREHNEAGLGRHENQDNFNTRRSKSCTEHEKDDIVHGYVGRDDRRKREREEQLRPRDRPDDHHHLGRHKEDSWRQRGREERQRLKLQDESKREGGAKGRDEVGAKAKDEVKCMRSDKDYLQRDKRRHVEQPKRHDKEDNESCPQHRAGGKVSHLPSEKHLKNEISGAHHDHTKTLFKERERDKVRKNREYDVMDPQSIHPGGKKQVEHNVHRNEKVSMKGKREKEGSMISMSCMGSLDHPPTLMSSSAPISEGSHEHQYELHQSCASGQEHGMPDDSRKGRSKLERWASHREREISLSSHASPREYQNNESSDCVGAMNQQNVVDGIETMDHQKETDDQVRAIVSDLLHEAEKAITVGNSEALSTECLNADAGVPMDGQSADSDKNGDDRHLQTVEKLKKRSERFKLPMPSEKEVPNKKTEGDAIMTSSESTPEVEVKQERPARKRKWVSG